MIEGRKWIAMDAGALARRARWVGVVLFALTAFLPLHSCEAHPARRGTTAWAGEMTQSVPVRKLRDHLEAGWLREGLAGAVWEARAFYPYLLVPLWVVALAAAGWTWRARRAIGMGMLGVTVAVTILELFYIHHDYGSFLPGGWGRVETAGAWVVVCGILLWRPAGWRLDDLGAFVSAQALLTFLHAWTFPVHHARVWLGEGHDAGAVVRALVQNYRPGFWLALVATCLAASPLYAPLLRGVRGVGRQPRRRESPVAAVTGSHPTPFA